MVRDGIPFVIVPIALAVMKFVRPENEMIVSIVLAAFAVLV